MNLFKKFLARFSADRKDDAPSNLSPPTAIRQNNGDDALLDMAHSLGDAGGLLGKQLWTESAEDIFAGSLEQLSRALDDLEDINVIVVPSDGYTALHLAAKSGDVEKIQAVLERKPQLEIHSRTKQFTPLHTAVINNRPDAVRSLIKAGADIEARANDGLTSLHLASMKGLSDVVTALLECRADVRATESNGATPLHAAAYCGHADVATQLLIRGADPVSIDNNGYTPLSLARSHRHEQIALACERMRLIREMRDNP